MALTPVEVPRFGGLDLRDDPQEVTTGAAIDMLNVELDNPGRLRARDGYAKFTTVAAAGPYLEIKPWYTNPYTLPKNIVASRAGAVDALNSSGAVVATTAQDASALVTFAGNLYAMSNSSATWQRWDGSSWFGAAAGFQANNGTVQAPDDRLVIASTNHRVRFSDPSAPTTFGANNWVDVTPNDGEIITAMVAYRELLFVFKQSKFFVFTGNSVDGSGNPVFNYHIVNTGVGALGYRSAAVGPNGVYFLDRTGLYVTTGGPPTPITGSLSPLFGRGTLSAAYTGSALNWAPIAALNTLTGSTMSYFNGRLYLSLPTGVATTNDRTFVLDLATNVWMVWDLRVNSITSFRVGDQEEMFFALASGSNDIGRFGPSYTADAGVAISAKYRTGFFNPGKPGAEADIFEWELDGSGSVTVKTAVNDATTLGTGAAVTLGTSPAIAQGRDMRAVWGRNVSLELSGTAPWSVSRVIANVRGQTSPGYKAA